MSILDKIPDSYYANLGFAVVEKDLTKVKDSIRKELENLSEENKGLKEIQKEDKHCLEMLHKENQILKNGIKELIEILSVCKIEHIYTGLEYTIEELKSKENIKAILEVIDND